MYYIGVGYFILSGLIYYFYIASPQEVGLTVESEVIEDDNFVKTNNENLSIQRPIDANQINQEEEERISFMAALKAPYVVLYGFCFFCVKFAVYAVLLWMPMYLKESYSFEN